MSSTNLDLVRSIYVAQARGDFSSAEWADPEIEYVIADGPAPASWTGLDGMAQGWRSIIEVWDDVRVDVDEYRELDSERVLALTRFSGGHGKASGIEIGATQAEAAALFHISAGKVRRIVNYFERKRALTDLGLTPDAGSPDS